MSLSGFILWRIGLAVLLGVAIIASASVRAPRKPLPRAELCRLVLSTIALYAVGLVALLKDRSAFAILLFAAGIVTSTLTAWLSRGGDAGGGPWRREEPIDEHPPSDPNGSPGFDWAQFEREFRAYTDRAPDHASSR